MTANKLLIILVTFLCSCGGDGNEYRDNTPTWGKLKVYYEEGIKPHVENQVYTFEALYNKADVELHMSSEAEAVKALLSDSCEAIVISRLPGEQEKKAFASRKYSPGYSAVAKSGITFITNARLGLDVLDTSMIRTLISGDGEITMTDGTSKKLKIIFADNSAVLHYVKDSIAGVRGLSQNCTALGSTPETINYIAQNDNAIGVIDYAWLSDRDDSINKANAGKIKFLAIRNNKADSAVYPNQSSFKTGSYPFTRTIYVIRKTGEFTLAKGFESFVAGPKGQVTFLKQGLLPTRQQERLVTINLEE
jgi:phosphate transport system substrate-binding protein